MIKINISRIKLSYCIKNSDFLTKDSKKCRQKVTETFEGKRPAKGLLPKTRKKTFGGKLKTAKTTPKRQTRLSEERAERSK